MKNDVLKKKIFADYQKSMFWVVIIYFLIEGFCGLLSVYSAQVLGQFSDAVLELNLSYAFQHLWKLVLCIGISVLFIPFFSMLGEVYQFHGALKHDRYIYNRFLDKNFEEVIKIDEGEAQGRIENDPNDFRLIWSDIIVKLFTTPVILVFLLYHTFQIDYFFTFVVFMVSMIKLLVPIAVRKLQAKYDKETREYVTQNRKYEIELTSKPYMVKLYGLYKTIVKKIEHAYEEYYTTVFQKSVKCSAIAKHISGFLDTFCYLLILLVGAIFVAKKTITAGDIAAMIGYFDVFNRIIENVSFFIENFPILDNIVERMKIFYSDEEDLEGDTVEDLSEISMNNLSFSYDKEKVVLKNLTFSVNAAEKTVITGINGSGKSTFLKIISGLIKNYKGSIQINRKELKTINIAQWRKKFAYVPQEPFLFQGSVKENIQIGNLTASEQEVESVINMTGIAYLSERIVSMSQNDLSGGEKQKVSIARALLKNTSFLILDEPSNNLDYETIQWLEKFIMNCPKTILYISHDERLIKLADKQIIF